MVLYTCGQKLGSPSVHPCGIAGKALKGAGYEFEIKTVQGYRLMPWTWSSRAKDREEVERLSGSRTVPILVLDNGQVISGSGAIKRWAQGNPAPAD